MEKRSSTQGRLANKVRLHAGKGGEKHHENKTRRYQGDGATVTANSGPLFFTLQSGLIFCCIWDHCPVA